MNCTKIKDFFNSPTFNTWINFTVKSFTIILIHPFIIKNYSNEFSSFWFICIASYGILQSFDLGLTTNMSRIYSSLYEEKISLVLSKKIKESFSLYFSITLIIIIFFPILLYYYIVSEFNIYTNNLFILIVSLITTSGILNLAVNFIVGIYHGMRKVAKAQRILSISSLFSLILALLLVLQKSDLILILAAFLSQSLFSFFLLFYYSKPFISLNKYLVFTKPSLNSDVFNTSWKTAISVIFHMGFFSGSVFFVNSYFGNLFTAKYSYHLQIARAISTFSQAPFYSELPQLNKILHIERNIKKFKKILIKRFNYSIYSYLILFVFLSITFPTLLSFLNFKNSFLNDFFWKVLGLSLLCERIYAMLLTTISLSNKIYAHIFNFFFVINIISILILIEGFDLNIFTSLIGFSFIIMIPILILLVKKKINIDISYNILFTALFSTVYFFIVFNFL